MDASNLFGRARRGAAAPALAALVAAIVLAGCASAPPIDPAALPTAPAAFKEGDGRWTEQPSPGRPKTVAHPLGGLPRSGGGTYEAAPADAEPRGTWWRAFADPVLDDLEARATERNNDIAVAAARLAQARALAKAADADRAPQLGVDAAVTRQGGTVARAAGTDGTLGSVAATLSYEVDLFGRLAQASRAAALDASAREALLASTRLLVQANVAQTYLALRAVDDERRLVRDTVTAYRETLELTRRRFEAGDVAELDVARVESEVAATESEAFALDRRRAALEHALAVLVGEAPSAFGLAEAAWDTALPVIPAGVPSTLLTRRPDVAAAQRAMLAAQARVGVAKAAWFPDIALTASGGYASPDLGDLFKWSARAWGIGALLSLPVFDGGRREAGVESASAALDGALASYREQVLGAFKDVEDELSALRLLASQAEAQSRAVSSAARATTLSDYRYRNGLVSQLDLLDARRSELANRRRALEVRAAQFQATVGLVRALGGSWEAPAG